MIKLKEIGAIAIIILSITIFFWPLFYPEPQLIFTPDFGRSDTTSLSLSGKYQLWESLKENKFPLVSSLNASRAPVLGEGEAGIFYLPNLLLFKFLNFSPAYNLNLALAYLLASLGLYYWLRSAKFDLFISLFGSLVFTFSAIFALHLTHIALLQSLSLLPLICALTYNLATRPKLTTGLFISLLVGQQLLTGFPQATVITGIFCFSYYFFLSKRIDLWWYWLLGLALAAIQLLPSAEFLRQTANPGGLGSNIATFFSFPLRHLLTFFNPYALGNPQNASYPPFFDFGGSIFWENTGYFGWLPLLGLIGLLFSKKNRSVVLFFLGTMFVALLLMLGRNSPLYLVFSLPPFNFFRVPSRFIWLFVLALIWLCCLGWQQLLDRYPKKIVLFSLLLITFVNLFHLQTLWQQYHLILPAKQILQTPEIVGELSYQTKIYQLGSSSLHNQVFLKSGWTDHQSFLFFRNFLSPNENVFWKIPAFSVYTGRPLRRLTLAESVLEKEIKYQDGIYKISAAGNRLLNLFHITHLISNAKIESANWILQKQFSFQEKQIYLSASSEQTPPFYFAQESKTVKNLEEIQTDLAANPNSQAVYLEKNISLPQITPTAQLTVLQNDHDLIRLQIKNQSSPTILIADLLYYPGWRATVDGQPAKIFPANIYQSAIVLPTNSQSITLRYQPRSFAAGKLITLVLTGFVLLLIFADIFGNIWQRSFHPADNRGK